MGWFAVPWQGLQTDGLPVVLRPRCAHLATELLLTGIRKIRRFLTQGKKEVFVCLPKQTDPPRLRVVHMLSLEQPTFAQHLFLSGELCVEARLAAENGAQK